MIMITMSIRKLLCLNVIKYMDMNIMDVSVNVVNKNQNYNVKFVCVRENIFICMLNWIFQSWTLECWIVAVYFQFGRFLS